MPCWVTSFSEARLLDQFIWLGGEIVFVLSVLSPDNGLHMWTLL